MGCTACCGPPGRFPFISIFLYSIFIFWFEFAIWIQTWNLFCFIDSKLFEYQYNLIVIPAAWFCCFNKYVILSSVGVLVILSQILFNLRTN
jgi:hypothetical protein